MRWEHCVINTQSFLYEGNSLYAGWAFVSLSPLLEFFPKTWISWLIVGTHLIHVTHIISKYVLQVVLQILPSALLAPLNLHRVPSGMSSNCFLPSARKLSSPALSHLAFFAEHFCLTCTWGCHTGLSALTCYRPSNMKLLGSGNIFLEQTWLKNPHRQNCN